MKWLDRLLDRREEAKRKEREHQLLIVRELALSQQKSIELLGDRLVQMVSGLSTASQAQSEAFTTWLKSFHTTEAPYSSTLRDEDEVRLERERLAALEAEGFPIHDSPERQLAWTLLHTQDPEF